MLMTQQSFIKVAPESHFPIQNLPYGIFSTAETRPRSGVAIGDYILDLSLLERERLLPTADLFNQPSLNRFMAQGRRVWSAVRAALQDILDANTPTLRNNYLLREASLIPMAKARMHLPAQIGDYSDFYSSKEHATNVGRMFRDPQNALLPNWRHLPVAYHGRASSVVASGTPIQRPSGQLKPAGADAPIFGISQELDFELEAGVFIGPGNELGEPIAIESALSHVFGLVLVNDWSARDIQRWEYQPLGPFLAKSLGTSISPWIVPLEALEPFRTAAPIQDPSPLPYLQSSERWTFDIHLEARLQSTSTAEPTTITQTNFRHLYWTIAQQIAHHTINGCNLRPGDLLASGTISGSTADSYGSMLELAWKGQRPLTLSSGETRTFLEDGDTLTLTGWCQGDGFRIGFGEVTGQIFPARQVSSRQLPVASNG
jgi:fumarylacetoacetase